MDKEKANLLNTFLDLTWDNIDCLEYKRSVLLQDLQKLEYKIQQEYASLPRVVSKTGEEASVPRVFRW